MNVLRLLAMLWSPAVAAAWAADAIASNLVTVGWIERVRLGTQGVALVAKLDTGATTSSLHAIDIRWTKRDGSDWVTFDVIGSDRKKATFEHRVVRIVRIKQHSGESQRRPTVVMGVCLGNVYALTEVNLADRGSFNYEFLLGRRFLAKRFAVDSERTYTVKPSCPETRAR